MIKGSSYTAAAIAVVLLFDVVLVALGLRSLSQVVWGWGMLAAIVQVAGGALLGHWFRDWEPRLPVEAVPAHVAFFVALITVGIIAQTMRDRGAFVPALALVNIGYLIAAVTVPVYGGAT